MRNKFLIFYTVIIFLIVNTVKAETLQDLEQEINDIREELNSVSANSSIQDAVTIDKAVENLNSVIDFANQSVDKNEVKSAIDALELVESNISEVIKTLPKKFDVEVVEENFQKILKSDAFDLVLPKYWDSLSESEAILGFRPHDAQLVAEGGVAGTVTVVETLGAEKLVYLKVGKNSLSILVPAAEKIRSGDQLRFDLNKDALHLFNRADEKRIMLFKQS